MDRKLLAGIAVLLVGFFLLYRTVILKLVNDWSVDDNYSHGFLIVPLALFFAWERRKRFASARRAPSYVGLVVVLLSIGLLYAGILGAELFTTRISILGTIAGALIFMYGWEHLLIMLFPIAFLLLMIPLPAIIFNQIAFPLQLLASRFGELGLKMMQIPVLREGNVISLANTSLEVAEACSGIRSLISLLTLGIVYGYFSDSRTWARILLGTATIPIAIVANGLRVAGTGIAAHHYGPQVAEGFFHAFSGWLIFLVAFALLFFVQRFLMWALPAEVKKQEPSAQAA